MDLNNLFAGSDNGSMKREYDSAVAGVVVMSSSAKWLTSLLYAVLSYDWLTGAVAGFTDSGLVSEVHHRLASMSAHIGIPLYSHLIQLLMGVPGYVLAGCVELGELGLGLSFGYLAYETVREKWNWLAGLLGLASGTAALFLSVNCFYFEGGTPTVITHSLSTGIPTDVLLFVLDGVVAMLSFLQLWHQYREGSHSGLHDVRKAAHNW